MPDEIKLWKVIKDPEQLYEIPHTKLELEESLEKWLEEDISMISNDLLVIGSQVRTRFDGYIDLLCLDVNGDVVIIELKRDKTPRDVTAQVLDYASWIKDQSTENMIQIADEYFNSRNDNNLKQEFQKKFRSDLPDTINDFHRLLIVAAEIDSGTKRIVEYLSDSYGVHINTVNFQYFRDGSDNKFIARAFLIEPELVESRSRTGGDRTRPPNLSFEELNSMADKREIGGLYRNLVENLETRMSKRTSRTSLTFYGRFEQGSKAVIRFIVADSTPTHGLKFRVYIKRFAEFFDLEEDQALALLPDNIESEKFFSHEDFSGFEGYFQTEEQVSRFLAGLS